MVHQTTYINHQAYISLVLEPFMDDSAGDFDLLSIAETVLTSENGDYLVEKPEYIEEDGSANQNFLDVLNRFDYGHEVRKCEKILEEIEGMLRTCKYIANLIADADEEQPRDLIEMLDFDINTMEAYKQEICDRRVGAGYTPQNIEDCITTAQEMIEEAKQLLP